jgi:hypothetical protein
LCARSSRGEQQSEEASFVSKVHAKPPLLSRNLFSCKQQPNKKRASSRKIAGLVNSLSLFRKIHWRALFHRVFWRKMGSSGHYIFPTISAVLF